MLPRMLDDRLSALIDDLFHEEGVSTSLLASILLTAQESVKDGSIVPLALHLWKARQLADEPQLLAQPDFPFNDLERQLHSGSWRARLSLGGGSRR